MTPTTLGQRSAPPARLAGVLSLLCIALGAFEEGVVRAALVVPGDAARTAANIIAGEQLWRLGLAAQIANHICNIGATVILYELFKPVDRGLSLAAMLFSLIGTAVWAVSAFDNAVPLALTAVNAPEAFAAGETQMLGFVFLKLQRTGYDIALVFFGVYCLALGILILRATFMPRLIGALMMVAGLAFIADSFVALLTPALSPTLAPYMPLLQLAGEAIFVTWLIVMGVNVSKWQAQAASA